MCWIKTQQEQQKTINSRCQFHSMLKKKNLGTCTQVLIKNFAIAITADSLA